MGSSNGAANGDLSGLGGPCLHEGGGRGGVGGGGWGEKKA